MTCLRLVLGDRLNHRHSKFGRVESAAFEIISRPSCLKGITPVNP